MTFQNIFPPTTIEYKILIHQKHMVKPTIDRNRNLTFLREIRALHQSVFTVLLKRQLKHDSFRTRGNGHKLKHMKFFLNTRKCSQFEGY